MGFMNLSFLKKYNFNNNLPIYKKIILINVIIFCLPLVINTVLFLFNFKTHSFFSFFELNPQLDYFFKNIWTIITYAFIHLDFFHIFWNMFILYFASKYFLNFFDEKKYIKTYFYGILFGGIFFVLSYNLFPVFKDNFTSLIGSSAAVYSVLIFICTYFPNNKVNLILFKTELKYIGIVYVLLSLIQIPIENPGGNIAHIGGAFFGYYYAMNLYNNSFSINFRNIFNKAKDYNLSQSENQKMIDAILDKISESGYESLTKKEKELLFKSKDHL
ncbi:MAG: rhomboid family intramembrane serine protease [Flavobacteriales bacterium]|nr:MAG: rhomboid family intramembrane serine protease [Flavobacteriales bacterium]